jgi:hypothetical protein
VLAKLLELEELEELEDPPPQPPLLAGVLSIQFTVAVADPVLPAASSKVKINSPLPVKV